MEQSPEEDDKQPRCDRSPDIGFDNHCNGRHQLLVPHIRRNGGAEGEVRAGRDQRLPRLERDERKIRPGQARVRLGLVAGNAKGFRDHPELGALLFKSNIPVPILVLPQLRPVWELAREYGGDEDRSRIETVLNKSQDLYRLIGDCGDEYRR